MDGTLWLQCDQLVVKDGVLFREQKDMPGKGHNKCLQFVIPKDMVRSTLQQLNFHFSWPGQQWDVKNWCKSWELCAARKLPARKRKAKLERELSNHPFQQVAMDILGPLPQSVRGSNYILVIGDVVDFALPNMEWQSHLYSSL